MHLNDKLESASHGLSGIVSRLEILLTLSSFPSILVLHIFSTKFFSPIFILCRNFLLLKRGAEERYSKSQKRQDFQKIICWRAQGYSRKRLITSFFTFTVHNTFFFHSHRSGWAESFSGGFLLGGCRVSFLFSPFQPPYIFFLLPNNQQSALMEHSWISQMLNRLSWPRTGRSSSCSTLPLPLLITNNSLKINSQSLEDAQAG